MSSHAFHQTPGGRVREITVRVQFGVGNLEFFDPTTQEVYRLLPATIHTQSRDQQSFYYLVGNLSNTCVHQQAKQGLATKDSRELQSSMAAMKRGLAM
jgi:hypothetical protein